MMLPLVIVVDDDYSFYVIQFFLISSSMFDCYELNHLGLPHDIYGFRQATPGAMAQYLKFPKGALNYKV